MKTNRLQFNISAWPNNPQAVPDKSARLVIQDDFSQVSADVPQISTKQDIDLRQENWKTQQFVAESSAQMVGEMRDKIVAQAREAGASGIKLCDIKIAIGEAIANAFRHGSTDSGINLIRVKCRTCKEAFWVEIEDEGETFDPDSVPEPDPNILKDHGMGIYIMRHTMDVVEYSFNHPGNRVRMVKWLVDD